jgi:hypothetical protein
MQFCPFCDNKMYVNSKKELSAVVPAAPTDASPFLYCKTCQPTAADAPEQTSDDEPEDKDGGGGAAAARSPLPDMCVYRSTYGTADQDLYYTTLLNEHSLYDPTLPILPPDIDTKHACVGSTVRYICYDEAQLKFIYLCDACMDCFTIDAPNTPLFNWKLKSLDQ